MTQRIRTFLLIEFLALSVAALVHAGWLLDGYEHSEARVAETVIAIVLLAGLVVSLIRPGLTREAGLVAQGFALLGTCVGLFTIAVGVGPRTTLDVVYHIIIVAFLAWGLTIALRAPANDAIMPA